MRKGASGVYFFRLMYAVCICCRMWSACRNQWLTRCSMKTLLPPREDDIKSQSIAIKSQSIIGQASRADIVQIAGRWFAAGAPFSCPCIRSFCLTCGLRRRRSDALLQQF